MNDLAAQIDKNQPQSPGLTRGGLGFLGGLLLCGAALAAQAALLQAIAGAAKKAT